MKYLEATDSNGTELYLFQLEGNLFISVPKERLEFKPLSTEELKEIKRVDDNHDYERAAEQREYDRLYESTYNPEDGSM